MIALSNIGQLHTAQGHLRRAGGYFEQALELAARSGADSLPITGPTLVGIGGLLCERNDLESAERMIRDGIKRSAQLGGVVVDVFGDITLAQLKRAQGDIEGALQVIERAEARLKSQSLTNRMRGLAAYRAQLWLAQGNPAAAAWAAERERAPRSEDVRWPWQLMEELTLARVLIAQGRGDPKNRALIKAIELLESLREAIEREGRVGNIVEVLMLQSLARQAQGNDAVAFQVLSRALILAEPEGFVRLFVNEGEPLAGLLARVRGAQQGYAERLLAAIRGQPPARDDKRQGTAPSAAPAAHPSLVEPLSSRELEVLRLVAANRSNQEIAEALVLSINTVKTHLRRIYEKLNTRNRLEAIERARELDLLHTPR